MLMNFKGEYYMSKSKHSNSMIVFLCTIAYFVGYISRKSFAVVLADMIPDVVTKDVAGLIGTALFVFYGVGQLISGYLGDRISAKWLMSCGLFVSAICNLLLPLMPNGYIMIPIWAINGFAQALLWPPIVKILAERLTHKKYVSANLIVTCGAHISTVVLYIYAPICIRYMSYKAVFFSASIITFIVGIIFLVAMSLVLKNSEKTDTCEPVLTKNEASCQEKHPLMHVFKSSGLISIFVCIVVMGVMRDGIESWLPTLYCEVFNKTSEEGILVSVLLPIFSIISLFVVRFVHKTKVFNNEARGAGILFLVAIFLAFPVIFLIDINTRGCQIASLVLIALVCALMHSCNFLLISCVPGRFAHSGRSATIGGICNACTYIGASISSYGFALISNALGWGATIGFWIGTLGVGVLFAVFALKKYTSFLKEKRAQ